MQETRYELWIPVHHARQLNHWAAATDALDHVILTAAALESVLEGSTLPPAKLIHYRVVFKKCQLQTVIAIVVLSLIFLEHPEPSYTLPLQSHKAHYCLPHQAVLLALASTCTSQAVQAS